MIWRCRNFAFDTSEHPLVAGIVNVTPDSFSGDGAVDPVAAVRLAESHFAAGADFVDVGGESTRPGAEPVDAETEMARVVPVVRALARKGAAVSVDTRNAETALAALEAGAAIVNDVCDTAEGDPVAAAAAKHGAGFVATWSCGAVPARRPEGRGDPETAVSRARAALQRMAAFARACGVRADSVAGDPGIGFGKSVEEDVALLRAGGAVAPGLPAMFGVSRKSVLGALCGESDPRKRVGAGAAAALWVAENGAAILRVHDVRETVQALKIRAVLEGRSWKWTR